MQQQKDELAIKKHDHRRAVMRSVETMHENDAGMFCPL